MRKSEKPYITDMSEIPLVVDIPYLADLLRLNVSTIRKYCSSGAIKCTFIGGQYRIPKAEVVEIVSGGKRYE